MERKTNKNKPNENLPSSMDFSADDKCVSYFNPVSYCKLSISRCRPWTNWTTPHIPTIQNNKCRTFADLTIPNKPQSISIMLEILISETWLQYAPLDFLVSLLWIKLWKSNYHSSSVLRALFLYLQKKTHTEMIIPNWINIENYTMKRK